jgi:hypothetical protein
VTPATRRRVRTVSSAALIAVLCALACSACHGPPAASHEVDEALHGQKNMTLNVATGVTTLQVRTDALPGLLYVVRTPKSARILPAVEGTRAIAVRFVGDGHGGPAIATLELNETVRWNLHINGGASHVTIDLAAGGFGSIDFASGVATASVTLPRPLGEQRLSEEGGMSSLEVLLARATPTLVRFSGGGGSATLEGSEYVGIGGGRTFQLSRWQDASDRVDIQLTGGVGRVVVRDGRSAP